MKNTTENIKKEFEKRGWVLLSDYENSKTKLKCMCDNCHINYIRLDHFRNGTGCSFCSDKFKKSIEYIKPFFEKEGYTLLSQFYKSANDNLVVKCPKGHIYDTTWHRWNSSKRRCPVCNGGIRLDKKDVNDILKGYNYTLLGDYKNAGSPITLLCPNEHEYKVTYGNFTSRKSRCTICSGAGSSSVEVGLRKIVENTIGCDFTINNKKIIPPYELDIVIPDKKIAIEYCGLYWHSELNGKDKNYHLSKLKLCEEKGYRLITIFEDEWLFKQDIVKSRLVNILSNNNEVIYARKCQVKEIAAKQARIFCEENHLQGYGAGSKVKLGLFHDKDLVSVMTFSKPSLAKGHKRIKEGVWELHRFCSKINTKVIGGASKLLKYFERNYTWKEIFSYADLRWSDGGLYEKLGFSFEKVTQPNYWYFKSKQRINRFSLRKAPEEQKNTSEWELRKDQGYNRIWDCGNLKYIKFI